MIKFPFLKRGRVEKKLESLFRYSLTVICASRGYGKTTAVRNFLEDQRDVKIIWFTIPDYVMDETCLCKNFCATIMDDLKLEESKNKVRKRLIDMNTEFDFILQEIKRTVTKRMVLVIDDYQFSSSKKLEHLIEAVVECNISKLNVVIISRESPKIKFELDDNCLMLHQDFLNFENDEIDEFFRLNGIALNPIEKEKLYHYSDGWGIAVYLSLFNYLQNQEINCSLSVENLICTVIYEQFTQREKEILLKLSVLDHFTREQAIFVSGSKKAGDVIDKLWNNRCFIHFDKIDGCYYLHNILKSGLQSEIDKTNIKASEIEKLNGDWYLKREQYVLAIGQYYKSEQYKYIYQVIESTYSVEYIHAIPEIIHNVFTKMEDEQKREHPITYIGLICSYMFFIDEEKGKERLEEAKAFYASYNSEEVNINGEISLIESFSKFNDFDVFSSKLAQTIGYFGNHSSKILNNKMTFNFGVPCILYLYHKNRGKMAELCEKFDETIKNLYKLTNGCGAGAGYEMKAEYHLEVGEYKKAKEYAHTAIEAAHCNKQDSVIICAEFLLARLYFLEGNFGRAITIFQKLQEQACQSDVPSIISQIEMSIGYGYGIIGKISDMPKWIVAYDITKSKAMLEGSQACFIMFGVAMILNKDFERLETHSRIMGNAFEKNRNLYRLVYSYIFSAIAKNQLGRKPEATKDLITALLLGEADKMELPFIEMSPHFIDLLSEVSFENAFSEKLIGRCLKFTYHYKTFNSKTKLSLLSRREEEVIIILSKGYKQKDICDELSISLPTVKTHIKNIYNKLGVNNKTDALRQWEQCKNK